MKDYSTSLEERKDFILGYNITKDGQMIVKFAKGKPWTIPYNEENEQILLDKMERQLEKCDDIECKLQKKSTDYFENFLFFLGAGLTIATVALHGELVSEIITVASVSCCISMIPLFVCLKINSKLKDLRKNKKFLEIEQKLNSNVRSNQNVLVNVSNKTKKVINGFPEDKPVFNINSFNYVPFKDLEQIVKNVDRNERFGFVYEEIEKEDKPKTKKKVKE